MHPVARRREARYGGIVIGHTEVGEFNNTDAVLRMADQRHEGNLPAGRGIGNDRNQGNGRVECEGCPRQPAACVKVMSDLYG